MHMRRSDEGILLNYPVKVHFAGWESTTLGLAQNGWELSLSETTIMGPMERGIQLAMRHKSRDHAVYAMTHPVRLDTYRGRRALDNHVEWIKFWQEMHFDVAYFANQIELQIVPMRGAVSFMPFDATPVMEPYENIQKIPLSQFKFFKTADVDTKELILDPAQIPELFDQILKMQKGQQKAIDQREKSRENERLVSTGEMFGVKPAHKVQAQIISLAM